MATQAAQECGPGPGPAAPALVKQGNGKYPQELLDNYGTVANVNGVVCVSVCVSISGCVVVVCKLCHCTVCYSQSYGLYDPMT